MEIGDTIRVKDLSIAKDKDVDIPDRSGGSSCYRHSGSQQCTGDR